MRRAPHVAIDAVVFDLDGVLLQSEEVWDAVREKYVRERGGRYSPDIQRAMMGMNSMEWSRYDAVDPQTFDADIFAGRSSKSGAGR